MYRLGKKQKTNTRKTVDVVFLMLMVAGFAALAALIWYQVRPLKLVDIKVPVATDKASYYPSQEVKGIFFGEIYYKGEVRILREVFCTDYKGVIKPPKEAADGDFFATQSQPTVFNGNSRTIGLLPADIPIGSNCVLKFTNVYRIQTPFGVRHETREYYTQNFAIVTRERREQLDREASIGQSVQNTIIQQTQPSEPQVQVTVPQQAQPITLPDIPVNPPVQLPEECSLKLLGICVKL